MNNSLEQLVICKICNQVYENPHLLPCGKSVCFNHIFIDITVDVFKCTFCNQEHPNKSNDLRKNEELNQLINLYDQYIKIETIMCENNQKGKEMCSTLKEILNKSKIWSSDPLLYINEYFSEIKLDMDLKREQCIKMINDNYQQFIDELEEAEQNCKNSIFKQEKSISDLNKSIESTTEDFSLFSKLSNQPSLNKAENWYKLKEDIQKTISKSTYMLEKFQSELLLNKKYEFELKLMFTENNFGELLKVDDYFPSENRLEGTIKFEINEFKSFIYEKSNRFDKDWCVIDKIRWNAYVCIKEKNFCDLYLELNVKPDCETLVNPIKVRIILKLLKEDGTYYKSSNITFEHTFNDLDSWANKEFYSIKEIVDTKNQTYNIENDSINIEIDIEILN